MRAIPPLETRRGLSGAETNESRTQQKPPPRNSAAGFLLMDSLMCPISFNAEAIEILSYPDKLASGNRPGDALARRIRSTLTNQQPSRESPFVTEFRSGRRRYLCWAFPVDLHAKGPVHTSTAVLLVRASSGLILSLHVPERFNFTRRERETLEFLLQGLSNKEIANRMNVSPNTIKVFLRLIMVKMGVRSRAAIVVRLL